MVLAEGNQVPPRVLVVQEEKRLADSAEADSDSHCCSSASNLEVEPKLASKLQAADEMAGNRVGMGHSADTGHSAGMGKCLAR